MKLPAFQFYPGDWRKDPGVQALDFFARGVWFEMLCLMHESDERGVMLLAGKPMPEDALASLLGISPDLLKQNLSKIEAYGVASRRQEDGALYSRRMVRDENLRKVRSSAGKQGGNPALLKQNPTTQLKQNPTPSSSSSSSSSELSPLAAAPGRGRTGKRKEPKERDADKDPRHHAITSEIGALYREAMNEEPSFNGSFWKALSTFLANWTGTANEWLARYWDVLTLSLEPFAPTCRKAADPEFLCRHWQSVAAEVQKLRREQQQAFKPKPAFKKSSL